MPSKKKIVRIHQKRPSRSEVRVFFYFVIFISRLIAHMETRVKKKLLFKAKKFLGSLRIFKTCTSRVLRVLYSMIGATQDAVSDVRFTIIFIDA